jgi:hypothetical protein
MAQIVAALALILVLLGASLVWQKGARQADVVPALFVPDIALKADINRLRETEIEDRSTVYSRAR